MSSNSQRDVASQFDVFNAFSSKTKKKEARSKNTRKNGRPFRPIWHTEDEPTQENKKSVPKGSPGYQNSLNGRRTDISTMSKEDLEKAEMRSNTKEVQFDPEATPKSKAGGVVELTYNSIGGVGPADFLNIPPPPFPPPPEENCDEKKLSSATEDLIEDQLQAMKSGTSILDKLEKENEEPKEEKSMKFRISRMSINEAQMSRNSVRSTRSTMINGTPRALTKNSGSGKSGRTHVTRVSNKPKKASLQSMDLDLLVKANRSTDRESFEGSPPPPPPQFPPRKTRKNGSFANFEAIPPLHRNTRISQSDLDAFASSTKSKGFQHVNSAKNMSEFNISEAELQMVSSGKNLDKADEEEFQFDVNTTRNPKAIVRNNSSRVQDFSHYRGKNVLNSAKARKKKKT